ncbi:MAG: glycogen/starch synthase [Candidatus Omnitrophica bacterium]|nr:glycogen/starch synthase [Candidatus Omnitrophota bacterium]MCB9722245.1 glycogen/starch synthase [Candidatus Omnitrophota bacterium]
MRVRCVPGKQGLLKAVSRIVAVVFAVSSVVPPGPVMAQTAGISLPAPRQMLSATGAYRPAVIKGLMVHPENPLEFDFIIETGEGRQSDDQLSADTNRLVKYFLTALTIPEEEMWVNLSPYEGNRIVGERFGDTAMGHDLLAQDYILKQLTSSLMYPDEALGEEFWARVHQKAQARFGTTDIPMNTFNKVWIVPDTATVYEKNNTAFVLESRLKVMLEEDYAALAANTNGRGMNLSAEPGRERVVSGVSSDVIREIIIPELEMEINQGRHFAALRQIYHSLVLAAWFKANLRETLLGKVYVDQSKTRGVDLPDPSVNRQIFDRYVEAFRKGVYDFIREDYDPDTDSVIPRRYFSGGGDMRAVREIVRRGTIKADAPVDGAVLARIRPLIDTVMQSRYVSSTVRLYDVGAGARRDDIEALQFAPAADAAVLADQAGKYRPIHQVIFDDYRWAQIAREAIVHSELNDLGVDGQEDWFRNHFADWVDSHLTGTQNEGLRKGVRQAVGDFVEDVNLYKLSINGAYPFDLGFSNVARDYLYRLSEMNRLAARGQSVAEEIVAYSADAEVKALIEPLVDGKLPVFADVVLESLIPALAREGNDPNAQVALGAGGLGFLDGETVAGIKENLKGNWGATDGYAGLSALPLYEVFQRRTIAPQEVDWDNQQDIKPFMITDSQGRRRPMTFKVNFKGKIHHEGREMHIRNDLQKKLRLRADEVSRYWNKLIELGIIEEVSKRGKIVGDIGKILRAHHHDFDGRQQEIYNLLAALKAETRPEGMDYEVQVYIVNNNGTPQFGLRAPKFDIFHHLYPGGDQQWIQYAFYGKAYVQLLRELGVAPDVIMLNEGQTVFAAIEMINDINRAKLLGARSMFEDVKVVYKTHTPNPAALPIYSDVARLRGMLGWDMVPNDLLTNMYNQTMFYAPKALADLADLIIAVSDENAQVARRIIVPGFDVEGAQNGSMPQDWYPEALAGLVAERGYQGVTGEELYAIRREAKLALNDNLVQLLGDVMGRDKVPQFADLENRPLVGLLRRMVRYKGQGMLVPLIEWIVGDPDKQYFDFNDKLLGYGLGANLLLGGEAQDEYGEEWVARFKRMQAGAFTPEDLAEIDNLSLQQVREVWDLLREDGLILPRAGGFQAAGNWHVLRDGQAEIGGQTVAARYRGYHEFIYKMFERLQNLKGKVIYIEKTGKNVMKAATTAVDLWLSMPDPTQEASGTSHQRVGLAGGLNVGVKGAGFDIQIEHGVNGWIIDAFPEIDTDELIDMFNVGVRSEHREEVQRNMHEYWERARPLLRDYIREAVGLYRAYVNSRQLETQDDRWITMLKSAFDQAHETVTIAHNNIRNKMAFDAALDGSGTYGIRRRKQLGEEILIAMGPVINVLVNSRLSGVDAEQTADHIRVLGAYLAQEGDAPAVPQALGESAATLQTAQKAIAAAIAGRQAVPRVVRDLIVEELATVVPFRVQRAQAGRDNAVLVVDDSVREAVESAGDPVTVEKYHSRGGEVAMIESTYDPATGRTRHLSYGRQGVAPYFNILVEGDQRDESTDAIIGLYEGGGYISESSTRLSKAAALDGRQITIDSRYDAQSNRTTHTFAGITTGPRQERVPGFELVEPEHGYFVQRSGMEIVALRAKGYYPDVALMAAPGAADVKGGEQKYGGIDLNIQLLDLQIRRDETGIPLPVTQQPLEDLHIEGFVPVIINIVPLNNLPLILGMDNNSPVRDNDSGDQRMAEAAAINRNDRS